MHDASLVDANDMTLCHNDMAWRLWLFMLWLDVMAWCTLWLDAYGLTLMSWGYGVCASCMTLMAWRYGMMLWLDAYGLMLMAWGYGVCANCMTLMAWCYGVTLCHNNMAWLYGYSCYGLTLWLALTLMAWRYVLTLMAYVLDANGTLWLDAYGYDLTLVCLWLMAIIWRYGYGYAWFDSMGHEVEVHAESLLWR